MARRVNIFQIVYNDDTLRAHDPDFQILDNMSNERPDWYEYWPIRNYFEQEGVDELAHYGFFSPKFFAKTGLRRSDLQPYLNELDADDVLIFSPFLEESALNLNQIVQGQGYHPGLLDVFARTYPRNNTPLVQTVRTTVYCNYFVASGAFWRQWLELANRTFVMAENRFSRFNRILNAVTNHEGRWAVPMKIFCIERLAGTMLADGVRWHPSAPLAYEMPILVERYRDHRKELIELDEIKQLAVSTGKHDIYIPEFIRARKSFYRRVNPA